MREVLYFTAFSLRLKMRGAWDDATGKHRFDLPSTISGVVGTWTRVGVDTQTVSAGSAFREYSYTVGAEVRVLVFHAWEAGYILVHMAQILETRPSGGGSITGATDAEGWKREALEAERRHRVDGTEEEAEGVQRGYQRSKVERRDETPRRRESEHCHPRNRR